MYQERLSIVCKGATSDRKPSVVSMEDDEEKRKKVMMMMKSKQPPPRNEAICRPRGMRKIGDCVRSWKLNGKRKGPKPSEALTRQMNLAILPEGTISTTPKMARRCYISLPAATRFQDGPDCIAWRNGRLTSVFYVTFHLILYFTPRHCV